MDNIFTVTLPSGKVQKGRTFECENAKKNLVIMTGMGEHSGRYEPFAKYLNEKGINVYVLDAVGQGLNAPKVEDQEKWYEGAFDENVKACNILVETVKKNELPTCLMGHSMGSFMTQRYLTLFPNTVERVVIMGSNKMPLMLSSFGFLLASMVTKKNNVDTYSKLLENLGTGAYNKQIKNPRTQFDWLSYNEENVDKYIADPYCGATTTRGFWKEFLRGLKAIGTKKELKNVSVSEEILIIAGEDDPVGNNGKGPRELLWQYQKLGLTKLTLKMFNNMRHEILNEDKKDEVYYAISSFLLK